MTDGDWNGPEQTYHDTERNLRARIRALESENEALKAVRDDDGELLTIAWMDGSHRSTKAHRERIRELEAERDRLREALELADAALRGANMNMNVVERKVRAALKEIDSE